jgi:excisionase family DNA binding protein
VGTERLRTSNRGTARIDPQERHLLLTVPETADLLRTTIGAIYTMISRGELPGVTKIGRRCLVRSDVLLDWLNQRRAPSPRE